MSNEISFKEFEKIFVDLSKKKIGDLDIKEISKYLLISQELDLIDSDVGDDKVFYTYDKKLLNNLSYQLEEKIMRDIHEEILYDYQLHNEPKLDDLEV